MIKVFNIIFENLKKTYSCLHIIFIVKKKVLAVSIYNLTHVVL